MALLDITGSHRFLFFTSPGAPRSKTGRQVLSQVSRGRSSSTERRNSYSPTELENVGDTREFTSSGTQHSSTQTDLREQEIQTDPWFYRSEGLPLLCCRGSHRKLERAQWNLRSNQVFSAQVRQQEQDNDFTLSDFSFLNLNGNVAEGENNLTPRFSVTIGQRNIGCGPSYGSRKACLPDPVDYWVSTYQRIVTVNNIEELKIASKKERLQMRQRQQHKTKKHNRLPTGTLSIGYSQEDFDLRSSSQKISSVKINEMTNKWDNEVLLQALDQLCQKIDNNRLI